MSAVPFPVARVAFPSATLCRRVIKSCTPIGAVRTAELSSVTCNDWCTAQCSYVCPQARSIHKTYLSHPWDIRRKDALFGS